MGGRKGATVLFRFACSGQRMIELLVELGLLAHATDGAASEDVGKQPRITAGDLEMRLSASMPQVLQSSTGWLQRHGWPWRVCLRRGRSILTLQPAHAC